MAVVGLDFHGVGVAVETDCAQWEAWLRFDFSWFVRERAAGATDVAGVRLTARFGASPEGLIPALVESARGPEFVCFDEGEVRHVDYHGRAMTRYDFAAERGELHSTDLEYGYEKLYLLIESRVGELLDRRGLHRVHSLGFARGGRAALLLLPMKGGKTTHGLGLLATPGVEVVSEDTPLLDHRGRAWPYPLRIGVRDAAATRRIPDEFLRAFRRDVGGDKTLIRTDYFPGRFTEGPVKLAAVVSGKWVRSGTPALHRKSKFMTLFTLARDCVFGLGLPQLVEYFLRADTRDLLRKTGIALRRSTACLGLVLRARCYEIHLGTDVEANLACLLQVLPEGATVEVAEAAQGG